MIQFTVTVPFEEGLHARPASQLARVCQNAKSEIKLIKGSAEINPKSILGIMSMSARHNDEVLVEVSGDDERTVAESLKAFFS